MLVARFVAARLAEPPEAVSEPEGITGASHEGAKIIAFRPRSIGA